MKRINNKRKKIIDVDKLIDKKELDEDYVRNLLDKILIKSPLAIEIVDEDINNS
jgi:hypothetical protein